jgi:hypothetical protein
MSHAVIGIFDSDFDAQDAVDELINNGFARKDIDVNNRRNVNGPSLNDDRDNMADTHNEYYKKRESGLTRFFKTIFGDKHEDSEKYSKVALEGGAVVSVYTHSVEEAGRAADILDNKGAVDVNERASKYGYTPASTTVDKGVITGPNATVGMQRSFPNSRDTDATDRGNTNLLSSEDSREIPRVEEHSGPGVGSVPTGGSRSKSRIIEWRGEESARLREDRDSETKFW